MNSTTQSRRLSAVVKSQTAVVGSVALGATAFMAQDANAIVVESEVGVTVQDGSSYLIDVNNDGFVDLEIDLVGPRGKVKGPVNTTELGGTKLGIARTGKYADIYQPGDSVDATGSFQLRADLYDSTSTLGNWASIGDTGYLGLIFVEAIFNEDAPTETTEYFGWLELTRGSISIGTLGLQNVPGAAAPIPNNAPNPVPVPPGIALMATGALGLAAIRRRKKAA